MSSNKRLSTFTDLDVYQNAYAGMMVIYQKVLPFLPSERKYDFTDQIRRSSKSMPRLIAERYAKHYQRTGFQKYLDDALSEANETIVSLSQINDLYFTHHTNDVCEKLVDMYAKISRQIYKLALSWDEFNQYRRKT